MSDSQFAPWIPAAIADYKAKNETLPVDGPMAFVEWVASQLFDYIFLIGDPVDGQNPVGIIDHIANGGPA